MFLLAVRRISETIWGLQIVGFFGKEFPLRPKERVTIASNDNLGAGKYIFLNSTSHGV